MSLISRTNESCSEDELPITLIDEVSTTITYIGKAVPGSATAAAVWSISRIDASVSPITAILYANGNTSFTNIWNNRAAYPYS